MPVSAGLLLVGAASLLAGYMEARASPYEDGLTG